MWKRSSDIFPGEWVGTVHEFETEKELNIGDKAKIIIDSQFRDKNEQRRINQIGTVVEIDTEDEWAYRLEFEDDSDNWFKRYHLEKIETE